MLSNLQMTGPPLTGKTASDFALEHEYLTCFTKPKLTQNTATLKASPLMSLGYMDFSDLSRELLSKYVVRHFE